MKRLLATVFLLLAIAGSAGADTYYALCRPSSRVNIRRYPRANSEYCGYLMTGDCVSVSEYRKDNRGRTWCKVDGLTEYGEGWVCEEYLVGGEVITDGGEYKVKANGRVAARNGINGKRTGWVKPGQTITVYAHSRIWAVTNKGYIQMEYLEAINDNG